MSAYRDVPLSLDTAINIRILLDCYGHDPGLPHPDDVEVQPLPTPSRATHRKRRPFAHRNRHSPEQPHGPPSHPDWKPTDTPTGVNLSTEEKR